MSAAFGPLTWFYHEFGLKSIHVTGRNAYLLILARTCRMFAYGTNALILAIFTSALGFSDHRIGVFMTLTLVGDVFLGTYLTLVADRIGRRKVLLAGSGMMIMSGIVFATLENFWILLLAAIFGIISITGGDFGPFRSVEESIISQLTDHSTRSDVLAWYVTVSTLGSSIGSEVSGRVLAVLQARDGWTDTDAYHALFWIYAIMGFVNIALVLALTDDCELAANQKIYAQLAQDETEEHNRMTGLPDSASPAGAIISPTTWKDRAGVWLTNNLAQISGSTRSIMYKLWFLLAIDALADGMVPFSITNYYLDYKFHPSKATLGDVTSVSYFLGAIGASFAAPLARRIGLINTMVFTHIPSSAAVLVFSLPPYFWMAAALLLLRTALNPMDQAPRSAFIAAVVKPEERTAIMGITSTVRTIASVAGPTLTGSLAANNQFWVVFVLAGICRLAYDFGLYALFINIKPSEYETKPRNDLEEVGESHEYGEGDSVGMEDLPDRHFKHSTANVM